VCSARAYLPEALVDEALAFETEAGEAQPDLVQRHLRCTLEEHEAIGLHHAIVMELNGEETGAVWARWMADRLMSPRSFPGDLLVLPDCPEQSDAQQPCREAAGHRGGHSWEINDPWTEPSYALSR
jgi:hypothetical protein